MTRILLDTHVLIWAANDMPRLSAKARALILSPDNERYFSVCSLWEIAIKVARDRADFVVDAAALRAGALANGYQELPIIAAHVLFTSALPGFHRDPFDRLLVAQALVEKMTLLTSDDMVASYSASIVRI